MGARRLKHMLVKNYRQFLIYDKELINKNIKYSDSMKAKKEKRKLTRLLMKKAMES